jgi:predicted RNA-binding protein
MCLSTVYSDSKYERRKILQDVAFMEAEKDGYTLVDLFGTRKFVKGQIKKVDFINEHFVLIEHE